LDILRIQRSLFSMELLGSVSEDAALAA